MPDSDVQYQRIAQAISYISEHFKQQPQLDEIAEKVQLSPYHFQRLFTDWAGVSPKKFLQYISIEYAKNLLQTPQTSLFETAFDTGLSGTGRLHDLFISIEGMTPGEYKNGGKSLSIAYCFVNSVFGKTLIASTPKGICHIAFVNDEQEGLNQLKHGFPEAELNYQANHPHQQLLDGFTDSNRDPNLTRLHVRGTAFQIKVWEALLKIPSGQLATYGQLAKRIGQPNASRAVGTAIGSNPIAFLIPCHRVIQSTGHFGGYMWGPLRKRAIIGWEAAQSHSTP